MCILGGAIRARISLVQKDICTAGRDRTRRYHGDEGVRKTTVRRRGE